MGDERREEKRMREGGREIEIGRAREGERGTKVEGTNDRQTCTGRNEIDPNGPFLR